jgi:tRNA pseudouridine55 synthase
VLVDKPAAMTSHDVVQRVRRALGTRAAGHTGTLDPFATGLLVVLVGRATRLARFVEREAKTYVATARLGIQTDTDDLTGRVVETAHPGREVSETLVREALAEFQGTHQQRPPQYSAKHVAGERSHRRARRGERVELAEVSVTVHRIELLHYNAPDVTFRAEVSAGTYIRAIARDLGARLRVGAHLISLRREAIGSLRVEDGMTLDQLGPAAIIPAHRVRGNMPTMDLDEAARQEVVHGRAVRDSGAGAPWAGGRRVSGEAVGLMGAGNLVAVARAEDGWLKPAVVLEGQ